MTGRRLITVTVFAAAVAALLAAPAQAQWGQDVLVNTDPGGSNYSNYPNTSIATPKSAFFPTKLWLITPTPVTVITSRKSTKCGSNPNQSSAISPKQIPLVIINNSLRKHQLTKWLSITLLLIKLNHNYTQTLLKPVL